MLSPQPFLRAHGLPFCSASTPCPLTSTPQTGILVLQCLRNSRAIHTPYLQPNPNNQICRKSNWRPLKTNPMNRPIITNPQLMFNQLHHHHSGLSSTSQNTPCPCTLSSQTFHHTPSMHGTLLHASNQQTPPPSPSPTTSSEDPVLLMTNVPILKKARVSHPWILPPLPPFHHQLSLPLSSIHSPSRPIHLLCPHTVTPKFGSRDHIAMATCPSTFRTTSSSIWTPMGTAPPPFRQHHHVQHLLQLSHHTAFYHRHNPLHLPYFHHCSATRLILHHTTTPSPTSIRSSHTSSIHSTHSPCLAGTVSSTKTGTADPPLSPANTTGQPWTTAHLQQPQSPAATRSRTAPC